MNEDECSTMHHGNRSYPPNVEKEKKKVQSTSKTCDGTNSWKTYEFDVYQSKQLNIVAIQKAVFRIHSK